MATLVQGTFITNKNLYTVLPKPGTLPLEVLLALLNSSLVSRLYISAVSQAVKDDFPQVTIADVLALPVPTQIDGKDQDSLATLVTRILAAKAADQAADTSALEREIDRIVYELYGLTEDEIDIVEGKS
jgi:adenine-specific DNA-methyltransferase